MYDYAGKNGKGLSIKYINDYPRCAHNFTDLSDGIIIWDNLAKQIDVRRNIMIRESGTYRFILYQSASTNGHYEYYTGSVISDWSNTATYVADNWDKLELHFDASTDTFEFWTDDSYKGSVSAPSTFSVINQFLPDTAYNGGEFYIDNVRIRKYTDPEPTYSFGSEETLCNPPTVNLVSPPDGNTTYDTTPTFTFNVTDNDNTTLSCELLINGTGYGENTSVSNNTNTDITANTSLSPGLYSWNVNCSDGTDWDTGTAKDIHILTDWWNTSFTRKKPITINSTSSLTNYQIKLNVTYDSDMQTDFDDLRFTNEEQYTELDYWIEEKSDSNWAVVWVEVDSIDTNNGTQAYMYYGNSTVSSVSNGKNAFLVFDDFEGTSLNTSYWSVHSYFTDYAVTGGWLEIYDMSSSSVWGNLYPIEHTLSGSVSGFVVKAKIKWNSTSSELQRSLISVDDDGVYNDYGEGLFSFISAGFDDGWIEHTGEKTANIGNAEYKSGYDSLGATGDATLKIVRNENGNTKIYWAESEVLTNTTTIGVQYFAITSTRDSSNA